MQLLTPDLLLRAYAVGIFPMAEDSNSPAIYWFEPEMRGILPLDQFKPTKSVRHALRDKLFDIRFDTDFKRVIEACGESRDARPQSWINTPIREACIALHRAGHAHSVEAWQNGQLVGGLYGIALGGAFFGESMFSHVSEASKVCLAALVAHLKAQGYSLLDTQYQNEHLVQFGVVEIPRAEYRKRLKEALALQCEWTQRT